MPRRLWQWLNNARAVSLAVLLHLGAITILVVNVDWVNKSPKTINTATAIKTAAVDLKQIKKEKERAREAERKKKAAEKKRREKVERENKKRIAQEKKRKAREKEKKRLALKKQQEKKKAEEKRERLKKARQEKEKKLAEQKRKKALEEKRKAKAEQKRRRDEMAAALKAEETASLIEHYESLINQHVQQRWDVPPDPSIKLGMSCKVFVVLLPGGDILGISIKESSGNRIFDESAIKAVRRAEPLPVPSPAENLFNEFREITIPFTYRTKKI